MQGGAGAHEKAATAKSLMREASEIEANVIQYYRNIDAQTPLKQAISLWGRVLAIEEKRLGPEHPDIATILNRLSFLYLFTFEYKKAEEFAANSLAVRERALGAEHPETATGLINLANIRNSSFELLGEWQTFASGYKFFGGSEHLDFAFLQKLIVGDYSSKYNAANSATLYERAYAIRRKKLGTDHPDTAASQIALAYNYLRQKKTDKAGPLFRGALNTLARKLGPDAFTTKRSIYVSAAHYEDLARNSRKASDFAQTETYATEGKRIADAYLDKRQSLEFEKILLYNDYARYFDRNHLPLNGIIGNAPPELAEIRQRVLLKADTVLSEILKLDKNGTALVDVGLLRIEQGRIKEAIDTFKLVTDGKDYESQTYLAQLYSAKNLFNQAQAALEYNANDLLNKNGTVKSGHPCRRVDLDRVGAFAYFYGRQNMPQQQEQFLKNSLQFSEVCFGGSHPQTVLYRSGLAYLQLATGKTQLARQLATQLVNDQFLWLTQQLPLHPQQQRAALLSGQPDALALTFALLERDRSPATLELALRTRLNRQGLLQQIEQGQRRITEGSTALRRRSEQIANIDRSLSSNNLSADERSALQQQRQSLEADLYRQLPALRIEPISITQVAAALPPRSALLEIQRYKPLLSVRNAEVQWGEPHYTALLLFPDQRILSIPLGPAAPLDAAIEKALKVSAEHKESPRPFWFKVSNLLFRPLLPHLAGVQELFLSPDGSIHTVPFAALPSPANNAQFLSDSLRLRVLTTGRDLIRLQQKPAASTPPVVLANPDYGPPGEPWSQLFYAQREADQIAAALGTTPITGSDASTSAVLKLRSPRVLHIATHGFFHPPDSANASSDPLSRSGLAFSGANRKPLPNTDDAILTAAEATALQLNGTDIVVLSACQTGLGDVQSGEGVYGLQRALTVAGARSTLLSLWKVDDLGTALFMKSFYSNLLKGLSRADALAATQTSFRTGNDGFSDEHFWAAFQLTGDWTPLAKP